MNADYTKVQIAELTDYAAGKGDGSIEARGIGGGVGAERVGAMHHKLKANTRQPFGHVHQESEEIYLVLQGSGTIKIGDDDVAVSTLDAVRISPQAPRCVESGPDGMTFIALGNHVTGDGRLLPGWWGGPVPPASE